MKFLLEIKDWVRIWLRHPKLQRVGWMAAGAMGAALLAGLFFFLPVAWKHHGIESEIGSRRAAVLEAKEAVEVSERYALLWKQAGTLENKWTAPTSQSELVRSMNRLAAEHDLRVDSQDFEVKDGPSGGKLLTQNLILVGAYPSVRRFLAGLENLPTLTLVQQARLEKDGKGDRVRAVLRIETYNRSSWGGRL